MKMKELTVLFQAQHVLVFYSPLLEYVALMLATVEALLVNSMDKNGVQKFFPEITNQVNLMK